MPDFGSPVAQNVDTSPARGMQTISSLLGLKQQQQAIAGQAAEVQQQQQTASQRAGIAAFMQHFDPGQHVGPDGTLDLDAVLTDPKLRVAAGDQFPQLMQQMVGVKQAQLQAKQQLVNLNDSTRTQFQGLLGGLRTDPDVLADNPAGRAKVNETMGRFAATGPDAARIAQIYGPVIENTPPGKLPNVISNAQLQAMDASTQAGRQAPTYLGTGGNFQNVNPQAAGGNVGGSPPIAATVPPGRQPFTDTYGQVFTFDPQRNAYIPAGPSSAKPSGPGAAAPGDVQSVTHQAEANFANVNANRSAANIAPQQLDQIRNALQLSDQTSTGGDWTAKRAQIEANLSSVIPGLGAAQDNASKIQVLDKFLTRITNDANRVLGQDASTDAQRDSIAHQNAQIGYTPQAIHSVLKYAEAQTLAMKSKGDAQDAWLKQKGNGITNQHEFENAWRQSYDPVLFQLETANPAERNKLIQSLPAAEAASLAGKRAGLKALGVTLP
jgi:hypothetical protein